MDIDNSYYGAFDSIADDYEPGNPNKRGLSKLAFWDIEMGRIPLVGWGCGVQHRRSTPATTTTPSIRKTAEAMKAFGHEFFMRYCWEMDGDKRTGRGRPPEEFVKAWIRIYNIFKEVGANNVVWVWCGNANTFKDRNRHEAPTPGTTTPVTSTSTGSRPTATTGPPPTATGTPATSRTAGGASSRSTTSSWSGPAAPARCRSR